MEERYRAVRMLSAIYKGVAILVTVGGALAGLAMLAVSLRGIAARGGGVLALAGLGGVVGAAGVIAVALLGGLTCFAAAQLLDVQLAIEAHTRRLALLAHLGSDAEMQRREQLLGEAALRWD